MPHSPSTSRESRRAGLALLLVATASTAWGQAAPEEPKPRPSRLSERRGDAPAPAPKPAPEPAPATAPEARPPAGPEGPGLFGDTKKFTRIGGWGSFGNAMGQFGFAKATLITMPPVQEELKLTDEQKEKLKLWQDSMRKRGEEMGKSMREKGGNDPFKGTENLSIAARVSQFTGMIHQIGGLVRENEEGLSRILKAPQRKRLHQIALQMEGISALTRPEIAEAVGLLPEEVEEIQQVLNASRVAQMTTWIGSMMAMRNDQRRPGAPGAPGEPRKAPADPKAEAAAKADPKEVARDGARPPADPKARAEREKAMRQRFESMRDQTDRIQGQAVAQIARTLNKAQRTKFENMLGPPFDPRKINTLGRPPGARPGTPPAAPPDTPKGAGTAKG